MTYPLNSLKQYEWDCYFLRIAKEVASKSDCLSRKIGAVIVKDKAIISTGYNGAPRGATHCDKRYYSFYRDLNGGTPWNKEWEAKYPTECPRRTLGYGSGQGLHLCQAGHAERNALIQAARSGVSTLGATLYCYCGQVCKDCAIEIINAGVDTLVYLDGQPAYDKYSEVIIKESGINVRKIILE